MSDDFTFGKDTVIRIAAMTPGVSTKPLTAAFVELCLISEVTLGGDKKTVTFSNFCTNGVEVEVAVGKKGMLQFGQANWVEGDPALAVMETAYFEDDVVWYEVYPTGNVAGNIMYDGTLTVKKWEMKSVSDGLVTVSHDVIPTGVPTRGVSA